MPAFEAVTMMRPEPCFFITRAALRIVCMTPVRFTLNTLSQSARSIVSNVCPSSNLNPGTAARPALANTTSTPPWASTTSSKSAWTRSSSPTSATNERASRPRERSFSVLASRRPASMSASVTRAPHSASTSAIA
jgi:hypothetical protein